MAKEQLAVARDIRTLLVHFNRPGADIRADLPPELELAAKQINEIEGLDLVRILSVHRDFIRGAL